MPDVLFDELAQIEKLTPFPCANCGELSPFAELIVTGSREYYTMELDPDTALCCECYEDRQAARIPSDPSLFDCYTPVDFVPTY